MKTLVILEIIDDVDRPWWEAVGLPDPASWNLADLRVRREPAFPPTDSAYVSVLAAERVAP